MEEITSKAYDDPVQTPLFGPEPGETSRTTFNDVDDYRAYTEPLGGLIDVTGQLYPDVDQQFSRSVSVVGSTQNVTALGGAIPGLTITITLQHRSGEQWVFTRFIPEPSHH
jgi:hypothetical protein